MHRKLPSDLTESTISGAIVSVISLTAIIILLISEFSAYLSIEEASTMYVDIVRGG